MLRDIPKQKHGEIALTYIFGVGRKTAQSILDQAKVKRDKKAMDWSDKEAKNIRNILATYTTEGDLKREIKNHMARLKEIGCLRGIRHRQCLPVRGQNTKNNARTRRGAKKTIANKKK